MRLGQLARKLSLRQSALVDFLAQQQIQIEGGSNTRMEDDHVVLIMKHFAPEQETSMRTELANEKMVEETEVTLELEPEQTVTDDKPVEETVSEEGASEEKVEVIRVQKVELTGLKVLGKIELPEPKKKDTETIDENTNPDTTPVENPVEKKPHRKSRKEFTNQNDRRERKHHNPIAWQREREAKEASEQRRIEAEREKERKKRHYHEKVKSQKPAKAKPVKADTSEKETRPVEPKPTTLLGKFWKWLRP
jgi:hypothetical protein